MINNTLFSSISLNSWKEYDRSIIYINAARIVNKLQMDDPR